MKTKKVNDELVSLNDELYDNFYVQELEDRLETDPLIVGGLLELVNPQGMPMSNADCFSCTLCSPVCTEIFS